nr:helix-turn-helix domain-containing protein [Mitsuokella multacida]
MCHYTHLTPFEREKIFFFLVGGKSITEIAHLLSQSKSTISRELHRNAAPAKHSMPVPAFGCAGPLQAAQSRLYGHTSAWRMLPCAPLCRSASCSTTGRRRRLLAASS